MDEFLGAPIQIPYHLVGLWDGYRVLRVTTPADQPISILSLGKYLELMGIEDLFISWLPIFMALEQVFRRHMNDKMKTKEPRGS